MAPSRRGRAVELAEAEVMPEDADIPEHLAHSYFNGSFTTRNLAKSLFWSLQIQKRRNPGENLNVWTPLILSKVYRGRERNRFSYSGGFGVAEGAVACFRRVLGVRSGAFVSFLGFLGRSLEVFGSLWVGLELLCQVLASLPPLGILWPLLHLGHRLHLNIANEVPHGY